MTYYLVKSKEVVSKRVADRLINSTPPRLQFDSGVSILHVVPISHPTKYITSNQTLSLILPYICI